MLMISYSAHMVIFHCRVMWLDIRYYNNNTRRITATGHQDGLLKVSIVNVETLGNYDFAVMQTRESKSYFKFIVTDKKS